MKKIQNTKGSLLVVTLIFATVFTILSASLLRFVGMHYTQTELDTSRAQALHIAEAGIEYYKWRLAHFPDDIQDGTGEDGPYVHTFYDPEGDAVGEFSLEIGGETFCNRVQVVHATSTGHTYENPEMKRTLFARIARPTIADYSYIVDGNVFAGSSRTIVGPYHGNGVIRMDANNLSAVTTKMGDASCASAGLGDCPAGDSIPGIYGNGTNPQWWRNSEPDIPFSNFDFDFFSMEAMAQSDAIHLPKISNDTSVFGYSLVLQNDGTVDIYRVTNIHSWKTATLPSMINVAIPELSTNRDSHRTFIESRPIISSCPLIFVSDRLWIEGEVSGKMTVVAYDTGTFEPDIYLPDHITYTTNDGTSGISLLAENNIILPYYIPNVQNISGIFVALNGSYGRPWYSFFASLPDTSFRTRDTLNTTGTIVSKLRTGTSWTDGTAFLVRNDNYDRNLVDAPPPLTPFTSSDFRFIEWQEVR
jgi:hypothetical protein